jgi:hypothetical protein
MITHARAACIRQMDLFTLNPHLPSPTRSPHSLTTPTNTSSSPEGSCTYRSVLQTGRLRGPPREQCFAKARAGLGIKVALEITIIISVFIQVHFCRGGAQQRHHTGRRARA